MVWDFRGEEPVDMEKEKQMFGNQCLLGRAEIRGHRVDWSPGPAYFPHHTQPVFFTEISGNCSIGELALYRNSFRHVRED